MAALARAVAILVPRDRDVRRVDEDLQLIANEQHQAVGHEAAQPSPRDGIEQPWRHRHDGRCRPHLDR